MKRYRLSSCSQIRGNEYEKQFETLLAPMFVRMCMQLEP